MKPIRGDTDHDAALAEAARLWDAKTGTPDGDRLDILVTLIDVYETKHHPIDPIEAIRFRMDQLGLTQKNREPMIGTRTRAADILNRKRDLSIGTIRRLNQHLGISAEVLVQPSRARETT